MFRGNKGESQPPSEPAWSGRDFPGQKAPRTLRRCTQIKKNPLQS